MCGEMRNYSYKLVSLNKLSNIIIDFNSQKYPRNIKNTKLPLKYRNLVSYPVKGLACC